MKNITIELPAEFIALCEADGIEPEQVIKGFIADLAEIDGSNGSDERMKAREYYNRVGYPYWKQYR